MSKEKLKEKQVAEIVDKYHRQQERVKEINNKFNNFKKKFYEQMLEYDVDSGQVVKDNKTISYTKVQPTKINYDIPKLEKALGKELSEDVVIKDYRINDIKGLVRYLKSCGVNPVKFKEFIDVEKSVNQKVLDNLEELGEISFEDLAGAYEITFNNPYYRVSSKEVRSEEDGDK